MWIAHLSHYRLGQLVGMFAEVGVFAHGVCVKVDEGIKWNMCDKVIKIMFRN